MPGVLRPSLREISSIQTWMYCFLAYVAILAPDQGTRDRLAYARLLLREAQRHSSNGWLDYDRVFRQQAVVDHNMPWNTLHPGIQAATMFGGSQGPGTFCTLCREPDHFKETCALAYFQQPPTQARTGVDNPSSSTRPRGQLRRRSEQETLNLVCRSWNKGNCSYPNSCRYRHICSTCYQGHRARDCPSNSEARGAGPRAVKDSASRLAAPTDRPRTTAQN
jgi:hypothetical protein